MAPTVHRLADRIRLYITLTLQVVPLIGLMFTSSNNRSLFITVPLLLTSIGIVMELTGRRSGRALALGMLGLQALVACGVVIFVIYMTLADGMDDHLAVSDLPVLLLMLVPLGIFMWNYLGGRKAAIPAGATSRA